MYVCTVTLVLYICMCVLYKVFMCVYTVECMYVHGYSVCVREMSVIAASMGQTLRQSLCMASHNWS